MPKCPKCENSTFKLAHPLGNIAGANFKMPFVVCSKCDCAIAVISSQDAGVAATQILQKLLQLDELERKLNSLSSDVHSIERKIR